MGQLGLDGSEVDGAAISARVAPLSPIQREVIRAMRDAGGTIRTTEVGRMVHAARGRPCPTGAKDPSGSGQRAGSLGCCAYAAPDGLSLMNRLMERGLAERAEPRGTWRLVLSE